MEFISTAGLMIHYTKFDACIVNTKYELGEITVYWSHHLL